MGIASGRGETLLGCNSILSLPASRICGGANNRGEGWFALLGVPRLYVIIPLCVFTYAALIRQELNRNAKRDRLAWSMALGTILIFSIASNLRLQQTLYVDYQWRLPVPKEVFMAVHPTVEEDAALFVAMRDNGYHVAVEGVDATKVGNTGDDELGIAAANGDRWVEQTGHESKIVSAPEGRTTIRQAESPVASFDGRWLAFLREDHGRARIWRRALDRSDDIDKPMTSPELDVLEMSFLPGGGLIFSAVSKGRPGLFVADRNGGIRLKWARRGILPFLQTVAGSHIASCKVEPGTSGCAIYAAGKHAGSPRQHATAPSPPGPRTRRL